MYKAVHVGKEKKKANNQTNNTKPEQPTPQEQPGFNWFIPYVGFYKVAEVGFLFNYFPGVRQKIVWFPKLTTIQKVK